MNSDALVDRFLPCDGAGCGKHFHKTTCPARQRGKARRLAAAVREAVLKRVRVCDGCGGEGSYYESNQGHDPKQRCPRCHGRGVVEGET